LSGGNPDKDTNHVHELKTLSDTVSLSIAQPCRPVPRKFLTRNAPAAECEQFTFTATS